ncbi:MAG: hypothetical protein JXR37_25885 [Kiritimatiellae bacterium]|nr:hypothetical protein [Kiritimatiellia bacterium]
MNLSRREALLSWLTAVVALFGVSVWFGSSTLQQWKTLREESRVVAGQIVVAERLAARRAEFETRYAEVKKRLPSYERKEKAAFAFEDKVNKLMEQHGLTRTGRSRSPTEKRRGELWEMSLRREWDGDLEGIVRFLEAVQAGPDMMSAERVRIAVRNGPDELTGDFVVNYAYGRAAEPSEGDEQ